MSDPKPPPRWWQDERVLALLIALPAALLAIFQLGRLHPDELFQVLEPAMNRAFGYGVLAWEWKQGLRNWVIPGFVAYLLRICQGLGIEDPQARRAVIELPQYALHAAMLWAVYRYSARRVTAVQAKWCVALVGLYGPVLHFGGRTMGESFSTAFVVFALERFDKALEEKLLGRNVWRVPAAGGLLLGCAVIARYGSAVIVVAAMAWLLIRRQWKQFGFAVAGGALAAALLAVVDQQTWGQPFHSFFEYVNFNVLSKGAAAQFGAEPAWYYLPWLGLTAFWAWPGLVLSRKIVKPWLILFCAGVYLAAITWTSHKEARFLFPTLVLVTVAGAPGWVAFISDTLAKLRTLELAALGLSLISVLAIAFFETPFAPQRPEEFRLVLRASRSGVTGMALVNEGVWGSPGFFWLGKNIPWFTCDFDYDPNFQGAMRTPSFNRVVTYNDQALQTALQFGFKVTARDGHGALLER
jgi:hypothetical protein